MDVERFSDAQLPPAARWQAVSFMRLEWPEVFTGGNRRARHTCPPAAAPVHFLVRDQEVLVSYAVVMDATARQAGRDLRVAGLGSVFTFPQYRREGWAAAVVREATAWIAASGVDVGLLFCAPALVPSYATSGWERFPGPTTAGPAEDELDDGTVTMRLPCPPAHDRSAGPLHVPHLW